MSDPLPCHLCLTSTAMTTFLLNRLQLYIGNAAIPNNRKVQVTKSSILIDGTPRLLRGGTIQWSRLPQEVWNDRLLRFKGMGYNTVDMYVSWRNHEPTEGNFDWNSYDINRFLDLCMKNDLWVCKFFKLHFYIVAREWMISWLFIRKIWGLVRT
jgi:hypothetical protein